MLAIYAMPLVLVALAGPGKPLDAMPWHTVPYSHSDCVAVLSN